MSLRMPIANGVAILAGVAAGIGMGFHAPQEAARVLVLSVDASRRGQEALRAPRAAAPDARGEDPGKPSPAS